MVPILADTDAGRSRVARAGVATRAAEEAVYEGLFYKDPGPDPGVAGVVVLLATGADDAEVRGWATSRRTGAMNWAALVTAFADMGDRVDGSTAPGRIAAIQALAGCAADELSYEFVLRPDGPGGSAGLVSQCAWIGEFWPIGATAINEGIVRWAGYALGHAQWSNSSIAHACVAASRRLPPRAIDLRLALEMCNAADSVNFDEAAPEVGIAMAFHVSVDEVVALNG